MGIFQDAVQRSSTSSNTTYDNTLFLESSYGKEKAKELVERTKNNSLVEAGQFIRNNPEEAKENLRDYNKSHGTDIGTGSVTDLDTSGLQGYLSGVEDRFNNRDPIPLQDRDTKAINFLPGSDGNSVAERTVNGGEEAVKTVSKTVENVKQDFQSGIIKIGAILAGLLIVLVAVKEYFSG